MEAKRFNVYGKWVFNDCIGLSCGVTKGDVVEVYQKCGDMVFVRKCGRGRKFIKFHVTNLTKSYFVREYQLA